MKQLISYLSLILLIAGTASCQPPAAITGPDHIEFTAESSDQSISITVNRDWQALSSESWCTVSPQTGSASDGPLTVTVRCQANSSFEERSAVITFTADEASHTIRVVQAQRDAIISDVDLLRADYQAQDLGITAETNVTFTVTALSGQDWIHPTEGTKGLIGKEVRFHIDENRSGALRTGAVTLAKGAVSSSIRVWQAPWHAVLDQTTPGIYQVRGKDYVYRPGVSQFSRVKTSASTTFRILDPDPVRALCVEMPSGEMPLAETIPLKVRLTAGEEGTLFEKNGPSVVLRESDSLVWLQLEGGAGLIVKK